MMSPSQTRTSFDIWFFFIFQLCINYDFSETSTFAVNSITDQRRYIWYQKSVKHKPSPYTGPPSWSNCPFRLLHLVGRTSVFARVRLLFTLSSSEFEWYASSMVRSISIIPRLWGHFWPESNVNVISPPSPSHELVRSRLTSVSYVVSSLLPVLSDNSRLRAIYILSSRGKSGDIIRLWVFLGRILTDIFQLAHPVNKAECLRMFSFL